ncbi:MarR family transcriptional regulator [Aquabacterium sp.]|uniref:MarR family winged helix-turn-helix transcriptional regulator n=1 Tax=Aquabacterium sp. TaxID=1872578 RepID=UPI002487D7E6|nr:MarR family transcriptional regulator [Aquabacterium sp.]MDI1260346.1 MarR family transcriptional regulator [Aquabacterium sp.]
MTRQIPSSEGSFNPHVPGIDYGMLDSLVGYGVRRAQIAIYNDFLPALDAWNITPPRFSALVIISRNKGLKLTELAQVLGIARSGVVALIDTLSEMGYVDRLAVPGDRRAYGLALTALGKKDLRQIEQAVLKQDQRAAHRLTVEERQQLLTLLDKLACP